MTSKKRQRRAIALLIASIVAGPVQAAAGEGRGGGGSDRTIVVGAGVAGEIDSASFKRGAATFVEYGAFELLEIELGGQAVWGPGGRELSADLTFKWPHRLTPTLEVMLGAGPTVVSANGSSWGVEAAIDVMWWPTRRVGLWIQPAYDFFLSGRASNSYGATAGPMVGW